MKYTWFPTQLNNSHHTRKLCQWGWKSQFSILVVFFLASEQGFQSFYLSPVVPYPGLDLHLDPAERQVAIRLWLGLNTSGGSKCPIYPGVALDTLGHQVWWGMITLTTIWRRHLFCHHAHLPVKDEVGYNLGRDHANSGPANILVQGCDRKTYSLRC